MKNKIGLIFLPGFFGYSYSFHKKVKELTFNGFDVISLDAYEGQNIKRPDFFRYIFKNAEAFDNLVETLNDDVTIFNIQKAKKILSERGCKKIIILGYGLGGVYALLSARKVTGLAGVVAWYPHLIYPKKFKKNPPNISNLDLPVLFFFGQNDTRLDSRTIDYARKLQLDNKNVSSYVFSRSAHAFAEQFIQGIIPNPFYNASGSKRSWHIALSWILNL